MDDEFTPKDNNSEEDKKNENSDESKKDENSDENPKDENTEQNNESAENDESKGVKYLPWIATNEKDLFGLGGRVLASLEEDPMDIKWISFEGIKTNINNFGNFFVSTSETSDSLVSVNSEKNRLAADMSKNSKYLKLYIAEFIDEDNKYDYYPEFGLVHKDNKYNWPTDAEGIRVSVNKVVKAIVKYKLDDRKYGLTYWTEIRDKYIALDDLTNGEKGGNSLGRSDKNVERALLEKILRSIINGQKCFTPDDWEAQLRNRGFLRERF